MTRVLHHFKSNVVAYLALFVALGGTSYAAFRLPAGSVGNRALKNHSVSAVKLDRGSIAGYVRDWAKIDSLGRIVASRPRARVVVWRTSGPLPGGLIQWNKPIPADCFALATTGVIPSLSYASAEISSAGKSKPGGAYVSMSTDQATVNVAVVCPQS
jgi:hypothetical protein